MSFDFLSFSIHMRKAMVDYKKDNFRSLSLRDFTELTGISTPTLSRAINGKRLDVDTIITICFFLDLNITDYFNY